MELTEQQKKSSSGDVEQMYQFLENVILPVIESNLFKIINKDTDERVLTNAYAFCLNPNNPHGLGDLALNKLFEQLDIEESDFGKISVDAHCKGAKDKYGLLDILIECKNCVVGIEVKIDAQLNNPLDLYEKKIRECLPSNKHHVILVKRGTEITEEKIAANKGAKELWKVIYWEDIVEEIEPDDKSAPQYYLWKQLVDLFQGGEYLDPENIELLVNNFDHFAKAHKMWYLALETLSKEANTIKEKLIPKVKDLKKKKVNEVGLWGAAGTYKTISRTRGEALEPIVVLEQETTDGGSIVLDLVVGVRGYQFIAHNRKLEYQSTIEKRLDDGNIRFKKNEKQRALIMKSYSDEESETPNPDEVFAREEDFTTVVKHAIEYFQIICE